MKLADTLQIWAADRGWGQYPLPRSRPRRSRPDNIGVRLVAGVLGLFGVIVIGGFLAVMVFVIGVFVYGAFTS